MHSAKAPRCLFYYSDNKTADTEKIPGCFLKYLRQAADGHPVCLNGDNITCGGGKFYAGFTPMPDHVPTFVSQKEKYKESPEQILDYLGKFGPLPAPGKYLNFVRADMAESLENIEGMLFIAPPDVRLRMLFYCSQCSQGEQTGRVQDIPWTDRPVGKAMVR